MSLQAILFPPACHEPGLSHRSEDLGLPSVPQVKVKAPSIQHEWKEKTVETLGAVNAVTAPAINIRKRKVTSLKNWEEDE